jgi:SPP1 family predicted phage head-tail adaptor
MAFGIADYRHTVAIQEQTDTADGMGGFTTTWADVSGMGSVRAAIWPVRGDERIEALKLEYKGLYKIRIRYRSGITTKNRIYWSDGSKTFNLIDMANLDHKNKVIEFLATEAV